MKLSGIIDFIVKLTIMMVLLFIGLYFGNTDYVIIALLIGILCRE